MDLSKVLPSSSGPEHQRTAPIGDANIKPGSGVQIQQAHFHGNVYMGTGDHPSTLSACKRSLSFPEMYSRYHSITTTSGNSTCMWLPQREEYYAWQVYGGLLWVKGKPGSGKSTLMRYVYDEKKRSDDQKTSTDSQRKSAESRKKDITLSVFFKGLGSSLQRTPLGFYRTALFQLLEELSRLEEKSEALSNLEDSFKHQCNSRGPPGKSWQWETSQLAQDFQIVLTEVLKDRSVYLYVDALDECNGIDAMRLAETFQEMIRTSPGERLEEPIEKPIGEGSKGTTKISTIKRLHICCSCRHYPLLVLRDMENTFQICVDRHNKHDIGIYVWSQLDLFRDTRIPDTIIGYSAGVFMWVDLVVEQVKSLYLEGHSKKEIEDNIARIPRDLECLYEALLRGMLGNKCSLQLICWVCFATRPLTLEELRWAMIIENNPTIKSLKACKRAHYFACDCDSPDKCTCKVMERRIQSLGQGLVEITDSNDVQFIHQSVRDFFVRKNGLMTLFKTTTSLPTTTIIDRDQLIGEMQLAMAKICVRYCLMKELIQASGISEDGSMATLPTDRKPLKEKFPFLEYAVTSLLEYAGKPGPQVVYDISQEDSDVLYLLSTRIAQE